MKISIVMESKKSWFVEYGLQLYKELNKDNDVEIVYGLQNIPKGDIAFFLSVLSICSPEILERNTNNIVIHASDLPQGKGWSPMPWQILEGKNEIIISLIEASSRVDSGVIYMKDSVDFDGHELLDELRKKLALKIVKMAEKYVEKWPKIEGKPQIGEESFYRKRTPADSELDINKTINEQFNLLRIVDNECYPAFFNKDGQKYVLKIVKEDE